MAAPRCARSFLRPAKRVQVTSPRLRPSVHAISRCKSTKTDTKQQQDQDPPAESGLESALLEERLAEAGVDAAEYKKLSKSLKLAQARNEKWEPKTKEESVRKWKELQDTPDHFTLLHAYKRTGIEPIKLAKERGIEPPGGEEPPLDPETQKALDELRNPINVQAVNLRPLHRTPEYGVPVCDLQLRTYSIRNLLLFADFAVRAAYYMGLSARGPIPLPRITERWTVPRANFIFKKSQENFERITLRRLIQIQDGHPDVVKAWLAFLLKHQYQGVGMKANVWEYESLEAATRAGYEIKEGDYSRRREGATMQKVEEILNSKGFKEAMEGHKNQAAMRQ